MDVSCDLQSGSLSDATVRINYEQAEELAEGGSVVVGELAIDVGKSPDFTYCVDNCVSGDVDISLSPAELRGLLRGERKSVGGYGDGVHVSVDCDTSVLTYLEQTYRPPTAWEAEVFGGLR